MMKRLISFFLLVSIIYSLYGQSKPELKECGYSSITSKYIAPKVIDENELPEKIQTAIRSILTEHCPDTLLNNIHFSTGRILDYGKMQQADSSINYYWQVPYYDLCYCFENSVIGPYCFKIDLDSTGKKLKIELPDFNSDKQKLVILTQSQIYSLAKKYVKLKKSTVRINFIKGHIVWDFTMYERMNKVGGYRTVSISAHTGEVLRNVFGMNNFL
jgi:hypothetical protein